MDFVGVTGDEMCSADDVTNVLTSDRFGMLDGIPKACVTASEHERRPVGVAPPIAGRLRRLNEAVHHAGLAGEGVQVAFDDGYDLAAQKVAVLAREGAVRAEAERTAMQGEPLRQAKAVGRRLVLADTEKPGVWPE